MARAPIVGGRLDGFEATPGSEKYAYLEVQIVKRSEPGPGRELYELLDGQWVSAGDRVVRCACGGFVKKVEGGRERQACPLCGAGATVESGAPDVS